MLHTKTVAAVIPARMGASRFPGKPISKILDLPMIEHVRRRACLSDAIDEVVVATCDKEIMDVVQGYGGRAVMTAPTHERCTDRVMEASQYIEQDIVVIVQGDEPLFDPEILSRLVKPLQDDESIYCTNLVSLIRNKQDLEDIDNVKAVLDEEQFIMYYSRSPIPFLRVQNNCNLYRQTGISAFTKEFLRTYSQLSPTSLEIAESVDFLRILGHKYSILGVVYDGPLFGVDRPDDISVIERILKNDPVQEDLYKRILSL